MVGIESNRTVSIQPSEYQNVRDIDIPESGLYTHLNGYGFVQVFRTVSKSDRRSGRRREALCTLATTR
jgi:hypothetical protein